jgi:hypothetical protein
MHPDQMRIHPEEAGTRVFAGPQAVELLESFGFSPAAESPVGTMYLGDGVTFLHVENSDFEDVVYSARYLDGEGGFVNLDAVKELIRKLMSSEPVEFDPPGHTTLLDKLSNKSREEFEQNFKDWF